MRSFCAPQRSWRAWKRRRRSPEPREAEERDKVKGSGSNSQTAAVRRATVTRQNESENSTGLLSKGHAPNPRVESANFRHPTDWVGSGGFRILTDRIRSGHSFPTQTARFGLILNPFRTAHMFWGEKYLELVWNLVSSSKKESTNIYFLVCWKIESSRTAKSKNPLKT